MSSFRIDRQYVTFETAGMDLTNNVPKQLNNASNVNPDMEEADEYHRKLFEKQKKKAEEESRLIIEEAERKSESILVNARKTAAVMLKSSQCKAVDVLEAAKLEGYEQGEKEAQASAEVRKKKESEELRRMSDSLKEDYSKLLDSMRGDIISLVMEITKKIIGVKLKESDDVFMGLVNGAIDQLKQEGYVIIHVSSEDYARYFGSNAQEKNIAGTNTKITVVEEEDYSTGDLVVESEGEVLDLSIFKQVKKVEGAFLNKEN